ncbi:hypothetical protein QFC19_001806 [Naganishia cerealis]|uniref:Uncharacterized protein n=1 Tax=Naganishia cerealis TaxID=610337 RepID=A0ACC2WFN1_9TREE|nr:hypothetical protein QFC19_001806 [Naganishia cerealis]
MLKYLGYDSMADFVGATVPSDIRIKELGDDDVKPFSELELLRRAERLAEMNRPMKSYIGMGYHNAIVPPVIQRNVSGSLQGDESDMADNHRYNRFWRTQDGTQRRLESLINYQTIITSLTSLPIANASLLDEATAAAEAMAMCLATSTRSAAPDTPKTYLVSASVSPATLSVLHTRAKGFGITIRVVPDAEIASTVEAQEKGGKGGCIGVMLQYPDVNGGIRSCDALKRKMPGRLVGVSRDTRGEKAYRLALQTREQHIRREKATSNVCTAQALLANMAAMYAVYHGPAGLRAIAGKVNAFTRILAAAVERMGYRVTNPDGWYFDTLTIDVSSAVSSGGADRVHEVSIARGINLRRVDSDKVGVTLDESVGILDLTDIINTFAEAAGKDGYTPTQLSDFVDANLGITAQQLTAEITTAPHELARTTPFLTQPVFNSYHSETEMLRYLYHLQEKDFSLVHGMIPLGSCTMKLNSTTSMTPLSWKEFGGVHPFAPVEQNEGYAQIIKELEGDLALITGFDATSLQPNSGASGEYAGLSVIKAYLESIGQGKRDICLIPLSAHGTNPAVSSLGDGNRGDKADL